MNVTGVITDDSTVFTSPISIVSEGFSERLVCKNISSKSDDPNSLTSPRTIQKVVAS